MVAYDGPVVVDIAVGSLAIPAASVLSSILGALDGAGLIARRSLVTALQSLVIACGAIPVAAGAGVRAAIVALALAPWIALTVAAAMARRGGILGSRLRFDVAETRRLLKVALPFALSGGLSALVLRFDVIFLSVIRTPAETASYDLALRLLEATTYLSTAIGAPLLFILSRRLGEGDRDGAARAYGEALRLLYAIGLPLSVGLAVLARPLVNLAFGVDFEQAATPLAIMGAAQWLTFVITVQGVLVMGGDVIARGIAVGALIAGVTIALDLVLVPWHGAVGAAAAMVASWLFAVCVLDMFHRRTVGIATPLPHAGVLVASAAMGLVLHAMSGEPLVVTVLAGAVAYGAVVLLTRAVVPADLARLRRALSQAA
jgi:O-antigen/teichoic acid export membrane protein